MVIVDIAMRFLVQFYDEWRDFRLPELSALMELCGLNAEGRVSFPSTGSSRAFAFVDLPSRDVVISICQRSVLVHRVIEIWAHSANSFADLSSMVESVWSSPLVDEKLRTQSWSLLIESFSRGISYDDKENYRKGLRGFTNGLRGPVKVVDPEVTITLLLDFSAEKGVCVETAAEDNMKVLVPVYFGQLIARGGMREALK